MELFKQTNHIRLLQRVTLNKGFPSCRYHHSTLVVFLFFKKAQGIYDSKMKGTNMVL